MPYFTRRPRVDVRESILLAGVELLNTQGITALSQPKVARAAGVKQSHLTYYFPKRSDLLLAIAEHSIDGILTGLASRLASAPPSAAIADTIAAVASKGAPPRIMLGLIVAAEHEPELRPALQKLVRHIRRRIQALLEQAGTVDSAQAALLFHATLIGLAVMHEAQRTEESAAELQTGLHAMLGLLAGPTAPAFPRSLP
jgi:AcrR family transcriptional regulator